MNALNKLVLIDGNSIAYRAFFALPLLSTDKGIYTNAIYGFTTMLMKIVEEEKPTHMLVAFDKGKTTFRHKTFKEYKGGRQKTPPELSEQFPFIHDMLKKMDIPIYQQDQYEADDIIGTLSKQAEAKDFKVKVVTGDKDLLQLVDDHVEVSLTRKGISETEDYNPEKVMERYEMVPSKIIDLKGLMGDSSDNIPGVPGVGEKTAIKLLKQFDTIEGVYEHLDDVSGKKLKEKLAANHDQALMSKELATIYCEAPIDISIKDLSYTFNLSNDLVALFKELEFNTILDRLGFEETMDEAIEETSFDYNIITSWSEDYLAPGSALMVEVLEDNYHYADIIGFAVVNETGRYYLTTEDALACPHFKKWLEDPTYKKIVFDGKRAAVALKWRDIEAKGLTFDVSLASYIIDPSESGHELSAIAKRKKMAYVYGDEAFYGKGAKRSIPEAEKLSDHLVRKAEALLALEPLLKEDLKANEQIDLYYNLEMPLALVLAEMEVQGVTTSKETLNEMGEVIKEKLTVLEKAIFELAGTTFNVNSPKQLGEILFDRLQLPVIKKTKTGYSTSADVLEKLKSKHDIIPKILDYRQLGKLSSTYIEGLMKVINPETGKIHTRFNQALTQTGRLSSTDPNLQNIPIRLEEGKKIRKAFLPSHKDWVIFAADYSQIELRVLAHIAEDEQLMEAFREEMDVHTKTAMDVFGVEKENVTSLMRRQAKAVNFGIVYGISDYGLSQSIGTTRKEAAEFIERYLNSYPNVKQYMDDIVQKAKKEGFVSTLLNRRRYLPEITSRNFNLRGFAERTAMNTPIQGSAADIIKKAMVDMAERLKEENLETKMLLQVHDELIFEAPEHEIERLKEIVPDVMEHAIELNVPLKVDYAYGSSWYDAK